MTGGPAQGIKWAAVDWGTSHLRLWCMGADGRVLHRIDDGNGMGRLTAAEYETVLLDHLAPLLPAAGRLPVVCCGMAGARQGWAEAPYALAPCPPLQIANAARVKTRDDRLQVFILPGIKQTQPADVMRGEETQLAGLLRAAPGYEGMVCLPGTHTKWAQVRDGAVQGFQTFMTGELFALLSRQSVLRHSVAQEGWDEDAFAAGIAEARAAPERLAAALFGLRAQSLLQGLAPAAGRARLSGLLIGAELAAVRPERGGGVVTIIGETALAQVYARAIESLGIAAAVADAEATVLRGLSAAYDALQGHWT